MEDSRPPVRRSLRKKKREREKAVQDFWTVVVPFHCDIITDITDKGDQIKVTACAKDAARYWLSAIQTRYPDEASSLGKGDSVKVSPEPGVNLHVNRDDGTLRIKGKKHLEWFKGNLAELLKSGNRELAQPATMASAADAITGLDDGYTVHDLLDHLPATGALKHGPTYIYRLWRGLLDQWAGRGGTLYVITPLIDARRLADLLLTLVKHRQSPSQLHVFTMPACDGDAKWPRVLREAKDLLRDLKSPNKKRLVADERLRAAEERLTVKFGRFHCKMVATCSDTTGLAELFLTSASFHKYHFDMESGDTAVYFKMTAQSLVNDYLAPLGLEEQVPLADSPQSSRHGSVITAHEPLPLSTSRRSLAAALDHAEQ